MSNQLSESVRRKYREYISTRTKAVLAHKRKQGLRTGGIPYGWRLAADGKHLEECPVEQPAFREIEAALGAWTQAREEQKAVDSLLEKERERLSDIEAAISKAGEEHRAIRDEIRTRITALKKRRPALTARKLANGPNALAARLNTNPALYPKRTGALWMPQDIQAINKRLRKTQNKKGKQ